MAHVEVVLGGKEVGLADRAFIDISKGCKNKCVGCYAAKSSRMGKRFFTDNPEIKEFDSEVFRKSCRRAVAKGIKICRLGKHSDSGDSSVLGITNEILKITAEEQIQCVFVSKSLGFDEKIAELIKTGNHVLHISLGMLTEAPDDEHRIRTYKLYKRYGCNAKVRIVEDVTKPVPAYLTIDTGPESKSLKLFAGNCILTPMRYGSKADADLYNADLTKFEFTSGYYRPKEIHPSWDSFHFRCGEIGEETFCCNCLAGGGK